MVNLSFTQNGAPAVISFPLCATQHCAKGIWRRSHMFSIATEFDSHSVGRISFSALFIVSSVPRHSCPHV